MTKKVFLILAFLHCITVNLFADLYYIKGNTLYLKDVFDATGNVVEQDVAEKTTKVVILKSAKSIAKDAFLGFSNLNEVVIPDGVTEIHENAFEGCSCLTKVTFPNSLETIEVGAFRNCTNLETIVFPKNLKTIYSEAFKNCTSLRRVVFPDSLKNIGASAFENCKQLESIDLPESVELSYCSFKGCSQLKSVTMPKTFKRFPIIDLESVPDNLFSNCSSLAKIVIPEGVEVIGENAFSGCTSLTSVQFPSTLHRIQKKAFENCFKMSDLNLPDNLTSVEDSAFNNCNERLRVLMEQKGFYNSSADFQKYIEVNGKTVTVKEGVRYIPEKAFEKALYEKVVLPNSLKGIRSFAFCGSKLKSLYLPESVVELDYMAFAECPNLKEVVLPNNITKMESRIFAECENLETVSFCENLSIVPSRCFDGCKNLKTVNMGSNVQRISVFAFHNCYRLSSVNIPTQCAVDTDAFVNCYSFFPDPSLPAYGFRNCDRPAAGWNVILEESITMVLEVTRSFFSKTLGWILLGLMVAVYVSLFFLKKHKFTPFIKATIIVIVSLLAFLVSSIFICQGKNPIAILFFTVFFSALGSFLCLRNCRMSLGILLALLCISELLYLFLLWLSPFFSYRG